MWIPSHQNLARHPKTIKLAKLLDVSVPTIIGHMHLLWWWCAEYAKDGNLNGFNNDEISEAMGWEGGEVDLVASLVSVKFLDEQNGSYTVHNWDMYFGKGERTREALAAKAMRHRERERNRHVTDTVTDTQPTRTLTDKIRIDKRREEKTPSEEGEVEGVAPEPSAKKKSGAGRPESVEEVKTYWLEKGLKGDPLQFYDHYDANGWMMGKAHIKRWSAAAHNWSRNESTFAPAQSHPPGKLSSPAVGQHPAGAWTPSSPEESERYARALRGEIVE